MDIKTRLSKKHIFGAIDSKNSTTLKRVFTLSDNSQIELHGKLKNYTRNIWCMLTKPTGEDFDIVITYTHSEHGIENKNFIAATSFKKDDPVCTTRRFIQESLGLNNIVDVTTATVSGWSEKKDGQVVILCPIPPDREKIFSDWYNYFGMLSMQDLTFQMVRSLFCAMVENKSEDEKLLALKKVVERIE